MSAPGAVATVIADADLEWLNDNVRLLNQTIRQELQAGRKPNSHAIRVLTGLRDRHERIARRLALGATG